MKFHRHAWGMFRPLKVTYTWETKGDRGTTWKQIRTCDICGREQVKRRKR